MACYRKGGCGPYEQMSCSECPYSKPRQKDTGLTSEKIVAIRAESEQGGGEQTENGAGCDGPLREDCLLALLRMPGGNGLIADVVKIYRNGTRLYLVDGAWSDHVDSLGPEGPSGILPTLEADIAAGNLPGDPGEPGEPGEPPTRAEVL